MGLNGHAMACASAMQNIESGGITLLKQEYCAKAFKFLLLRYCKMLLSNYYKSNVMMQIIIWECNKTCFYFIKLSNSENQRLSRRDSTDAETMETTLSFCKLS